MTLMLAGAPAAQRAVSLTVLGATLAGRRRPAGRVLAATDRWSSRSGDGRRRWASSWSPTSSPRSCCVVSAAVTLAVLVYSIGQGMADGDEEAPLSIFHPTYLVLTAGVTNAFLSGDLFNLYVGFEILLVASYVLLTLGGTANRIRAGTTYVVVSLLSSLIFLTAIGLIYAATGTAQHGAARRPARRRCPDNLQPDAAGHAAARLRYQGGGLPAVGLAARQLPHRARLRSPRSSPAC